MKTLKSKIIEILHNGVFKGKLFEGQGGFWADAILSLFKQQMKGLVGEQESERWGAKGSIIKTESIARNILREKLLKNIESL